MALDGGEGDKFDSQILAENVTFLNECFDNTFVLQDSLPVIREYVSEIQSNTAISKGKALAKRRHSSKSFELDSSINQSKILTQSKKAHRFLKNWGLPEEITRRYEERGITQMFEWQVSCLSNSKVLADNSNLVYSAPTSAGKTLVAEILTIKTILERQKKVIIILPFVSIVREKMFYLQDILSSSGIRVEGFMGSQSPPGGLQAVHIAICTIEKANSLLNRLLDENNISELGAIVVDELHLLGDPHRGYILELLLTKIKYISSRLNIQIQIVGMSATLPNLEELAKWLDAELFITDFRPIPLNEFCLINNKFYDKHGKHIHNVSHENPTIDSDNILNICLDTIKDGYSLLIFCMTKNRCENLAQNISTSFYKLGCSSSESGCMLKKQLKSESILEVLEQLKNCPVGLDAVLKNVISFGVAYHHAGLTFDERDIIEGAFKSGALRVLVATSTLSSGVNLPARKVIIRSPMFQRQPINILTYKQMIGRAGRMGKDTEGESILICTEAEKKIGFELMSGTLDPVKSCIDSEDKYMRSMLEMIASEDVCTKKELDLYSTCTLLYTQKVVSDNLLLEGTLKELVNFELIRLQAESEDESYVATALGKACLSSSMAPNDGLSLFCELQKARQCLVLETDLHLIYLVTPYSVSNQWSDIDWLHLLTLWESLTKAMKRVGELVGVKESFIIRSLRGTRNTKMCPKNLNIHKRFYTALALQDLVNEVPLSEVAVKFQCARGFLQGLQQAAATFAGMVTAFCRQLGWKNMEMLISQFQDRLHFGIHSELIEIMKLPSLNSTRARALYDAGFECITNIASADINVIENIFHKAVPFQSDKKREDDDDLELRKRKNIKNIWISGCCGMTPREAANILILEARKYLKQEIGVTEIKWGNEVNCNIANVDKSSVNEKFITSQRNIKIEDNGSESEIIQNNHHNHVSVISNDELEDKIKRNHSNDLSVMEASIKIKDENISASDIINKEKDVCLDNLMQLKSENKLEIKSETEESPQLFGESNKSSPQILNKDEILWDSLSFTNTAIQNISKGRSSGTLFSPNISFGENEVNSNVSNNILKDISNTLCISNKDVSLFSSDAESSFLDESFSDNKTKQKVLDSKPSNHNTAEVIDTLEFISSNTMLNAFKSSIFESRVNTEEDDEIKLIYDEDNDIFENLANTAAVMDNNEVLNTQTNTDINVKNSFISPLKRQCDTKNGGLYQASMCKKKKTNNQSPINETNVLCLNSKKSEHLVMKFSSHTLVCYVLREVDILKIKQFLGTNYSAALIIEKGATSPIRQSLIGSKILESDCKQNPPKQTNTSFPVKAMTICFQQNLCFYLDLSTLTNNSSSIQAFKLIISKWFDQKNLMLRILSLKSNFVNLKQYFEQDISARCSDVALKEWLIDSDTRISSIFDLALKYCEIDLPNMELEVDNQNKRFKDLQSAEEMCLKAWCMVRVAEHQEQVLLKQYHSSEVLYELEDIETHVLKILANSEKYGITVDKSLASKLLIDVKKSQEILQMKAFKITGYHFNFNSSKSVAKVLGLNKGRKVSTKKSVLTAHSSPLASVVIYWRKLNSILTKTLYPLTEKACVYSSDNRIAPSYTMYTCTGRISMHEPNLQNVPRTFSIPVNYLSLKDSESSPDVMEFNCRNIFKAAAGHALVSADYCQLEMRILTHYSADPVLTKIMSSDVDVFKSIASSWSGVLEEEVDDDLRQKAKQLCYGIIYGMGNKTLAQNLDVTETEAAVFMETFYKTYPAIKAFTNEVLEKCRKTGYVETLKKRRRYLPDINSTIGVKRSAAERQAINTMIQGSAADIAKAAMCAIDTRTHSHTHKPTLVLQMHDELIYEVHVNSKQAFIATIKKEMEGTIRLSVPLPVKVKTGYAWGSLEEIKIKQ